DLVFISNSETGRLEGHLGAFDGGGALLVGDREDFARRGGMIALFVENSRVRFSVNQASVERSGLRVSSKLLTLAREVVAGDRR
ncbi:MAG: YfiR family protein, partial [bacterium]|nr:YfiR family protein [bacterium]